MGRRTTTFATRLREARIEARLYQHELAAAVGVDRVTVTQWETGYIHYPRAEQALLLAEALGVDVYELILGRRRRRH